MVEIRGEMGRDRRLVHQSSWRLGRKRISLTSRSSRWLIAKAGFLLLHIRQRCGNAVQHPLDVHIDHPVPFVDLEALKRRLRHQPLLIMTSIRPYVCTALSTNLFTWSHCVTSVVTASTLAPLLFSSFANDCKRSARLAPIATLAPCAHRSRAVASPSPLLAPVMTTTFASMLLLITLTAGCYLGRRRVRSCTAIPAAQSTTSVLTRYTPAKPAPLATRPSTGLATPSAKSRKAVYAPMARPRLCDGA